MIVGITNDHAATKLKLDLIDYLSAKGIKVVNYGTDTDEPFDYPLAANALCDGLKNNECELGIAICGTGVGISIACNKHKGIRACCCSEIDSARLCREHNNANVICFGARIIDLDTAKQIVDTFLETPFSNGERHLKRIAMLKDIEDNN